MPSVSLPRTVGGVHSPGGLRLPGPPGLLVRLWVALHRSSLDRALARGEDPVLRSALAVRAGQLASPCGRARVANALERALRSALPPRPFTAAVAADPAAMRLHRSQILDLVDRLHSPEPVAAAGVARLLVLLRDGCSPVYLPGPPEALCDDLERADRLLAPVRRAWPGDG
jgi:hypothetical protein